MFDQDFDPYETLKKHDEWLVQVVSHMEQVAKSGLEAARHIEKQEGIMRHLALTIKHQQKLILKLNERLERLEKQ